MKAFRSIAAAGVLVFSILAQAQPAKPAAATPRNVIIFVADGLRHGSVNAQDTPALWSVRTRGVHFRNSYSIFPTFTTANASAIATGHLLGDTGDYSNTIWVGYPIFNTGTPVPFLENDQILANVDSHFGGNYLGERTLLGLAREKGYNTAAIGKLGPTAIQDVAALASANGSLPAGVIIVDDATGAKTGLALPDSLLAKLKQEDLPPQAPGRNNGYPAKSPYDNGYSGDAHHAGTLQPNTVQQRWFADVATEAVLPLFAQSGKPFALLYWSRDPDASQHGEGDSLGSLTPGINGPTATAGVRNADRNLQQLLDWLHAHPVIERNTDVFVTSDHGFATITRSLVAPGRPTTSQSAKQSYADTAAGDLPSGFLAMDLARDLKTNLWDPDRPGANGAPFAEVLDGQHPSHGSALLGERIEKPDGSDAEAIVAANGGSDLIYVPSGDAANVRQIVNAVLAHDYASAVFVDDKYGAIPGTLPLSAINLVGASKVPRPAMVVAFTDFERTQGDLQSGVQLSDTGLQEGQGMHGGFGRDQTYNNMAAMGPDFKPHYTDDAPVSNADIVPTLAHAMGITLQPAGKLQGRVIREALRGQAGAAAVKIQKQVSQPADGRATVLEFQVFGGVRYLRSAERQGPASPGPH